MAGAFFVFTLALPTAVLSHGDAGKTARGRWTGGATGSKRGISYVRGGPLASLCWYFCATAPSMGPSTPVLMMASEVPRIFVSYRPCLSFVAIGSLLGGRRGSPASMQSGLSVRSSWLRDSVIHAASGFSGLRSGFVALRGASVRFRCGAGASFTHHQRYSRGTARHA